MMTRKGPLTFYPTAADARPDDPLPGVVGDSPAMRQVYEEIGQVAPTTATALILGISVVGRW